MKRRGIVDGGLDPPLGQGAGGARGIGNVDNEQMIDGFVPRVIERNFDVRAFEAPGDTRRRWLGGGRSILLSV